MQKSSCARLISKLSIGQIEGLLAGDGRVSSWNHRSGFPKFKVH